MCQRNQAADRTIEIRLISSRLVHVDGKMGLKFAQIVKKNNTCTLRMPKEIATLIRLGV